MEVSIKPSRVGYDQGLADEFQKQIGFILPTEYMDFLKKYNGGTPEDNVVKLDGQEIESISVRYFYGVGLKDIEDLQNLFEVLEGRVPRECIPIAEVEGGNVLCVNLAPDRYGTIYLWDHDIELLLPDGEEIMIEHMYSLEELVSKMEPFDIEEYEVPKGKVLWIDPDFLKKLEEGSEE